MPVTSRRCVRKLWLVMAVVYAGALGLSRIAKWFIYVWETAFLLQTDLGLPRSYSIVGYRLIALFRLRWALRNQRQRRPFC
jgi:hypothetical protein